MGIEFFFKVLTLVEFTGVYQDLNGFITPLTQVISCFLISHQPYNSARILLGFIIGFYQYSNIL